jgi:predicted AlkP superfamily pyrophosphatase or phosphodiesterase
VARGPGGPAYDRRMRPTVVVNLVGLSRSLLGPHTPTLQSIAAAGRVRTIVPPLPAVTTTVQSSMLTGRPVSSHGIVANGWYDRTLAEVQFWKQSNRLVQGEKIWHAARRRDPSFTCAQMFWWYNMYAEVDVSVTPRPIYCADGRKIPDCYAEPPELRDQLQRELGTFPLFRFWGPAASIESSRWIAEASLRVHEIHRPTLMFVYLPHLDYPLQKFGPGHPAIPAELAKLDALVARLASALNDAGARILWLSEYGIEAVDTAGMPNRVLRQAGWLRVREELGHEMLDAGASDAFAVADHQVAHVYVREPALVPKVAERLAAMPEVERVLDREQRVAMGIDHERSGDLMLVARRGAWFAYDYWLDDARAPDFARTVDIHRKPGYDPRELLLDPSRPLIKAGIAWRLLRKRLGFRTLMDVIPLDASLVRGSHGRVDQPEDERPILISDADLGRGGQHDAEEIDATAIHDLVLESIFGRVD